MLVPACTVHRLGNGTLQAELSGELDVDTSVAVRDDLLAALDQDRPTRLRIDMHAVSFLSATTLGALIATRNRAQELGCQTTVVEPSHPVRRILHLTELYQLLCGPGPLDGTVYRSTCHLP